MENLRREILTELRTLQQSNVDAEGLLSDFEQYCKTFFNRRKEGNKGIIVGINNQELLMKIFGFKYPILINDTVHYVIRIKYANVPRVLITFRKSPAGKYSPEQEEWFRKLFQHYNADKNLNLNLVFSSGTPMQPLEISGDWAKEFFVSPQQNFRNLDGIELIEKVEIYCPKINDDILCQSLEDVFLIPYNYRLVSDFEQAIAAEAKQKAQKQDTSFLDTFMSAIFDNSEDQKVNHHLDFWKKFGYLCNPETVNFVLLNHVNDFVVQLFCFLIKRYIEVYDISDDNINLLKRVFYVSETNVLKNSKATMDLSENIKNLLCNLYDDISNIQKPESDYALCVCTLENLEHLPSETKYKAEKTLSKIKQYIFDTLKKTLLANNV